MKLGIIDLVEEALETISSDSYELDSAKNDIELLLKYLLHGEDYFLNVISRVKSPESVKEKILKYNLYKKYETAEELISGISDIIGIRIECRFIPDEEKVYMKLLQLFDIDLGEGYYSSSKNTKVSIKLDEPQPQFQRNGFEIYKIDGRYVTDEKVYNFELQIKSLVNNFWGDIEHRILYKNYNYLLSERFIRDMMSSIKENLSLIDKQLRVVFDHVFNLETTTNTSLDQIKTVLKKMTYDIYFHKIRTQLGFVVDFRSIVDLIVDYVFMKENGSGDRKIGEDFLNILKRLSGTLEREQAFDERIDLSDTPTFDTELEEKIGEKIVEIINLDFRWNIFFRIIFDIEDNIKDYEVIEKFTKYLVNRFDRITCESLKGSRFVDKDDENIQRFITESIVDSFIIELDVETLDDSTLDLLKHNLQVYILGIVSIEQWEESKSDIREGILDFKSE